ncbi:Isoprene synthase [Spatholobus suberectus]|nr:Isoprene synthase [Spatholobus suberectus]
MATDLLCLSNQFSSPTPTLTTRFPQSKNFTQKTSLANPKPWRVICAVSSQFTQLTEDNSRRSANYQPNLWNFEFLQSLENDLKVEKLEERATKLEEEVRRMINRVDTEPLRLLELIDDVQRLGMTYKFEKDIIKALDKINASLDEHENQKTGLHATALSFRLLRQHGFEVSQDVFKRFKDKEGGFSAQLKGDVQGLLSLYEASYLGFEGENLVDEARAFSIAHLKNNLKEGINTKVAEQVSHALELSYHRRLHRLEARWFLDKYEPTEPHHQLLLELAKLDFNMVQSLHQKELRELSRWWREMGLASKLDFVRDRLMEVYFWALGMAPDPQFSECRKAVTKMFGLVTIIDDVYDVYGTLDELQLFTDAVERWDVNATNTLPDYMKLCYLALYNTVNDTAYSILKEKGHNSLSYLAKSWCELCKAFLQEAKWSNNKIIPAFSKYLENASVSSSGVTLLAPSYFSVCKEQDISDQALYSLTNFHGLVRSSCAIFRLCNDLATSAAELERGETTNSITSYMNENGTSEEQAREELRKLIDAEWKKMNRERVLDSTLPKDFMAIAINMARVSHCTSQFTQLTEDNSRRSANYQPNLWNFEFLQSLENDLKVEKLEERATKLEEEVRRMINRVDTEPLRLLELIDDVQRLGMTYKFEKDIIKALDKINASLDEHENQKTGLHATALSFRLLRQHGFEVSQDVFKRFKDKEGGFIAELKGNVQGLLSLYEASYLGFEGENLLDEARAFSIAHLKNNLKEGINTKVAEQVSHALELPYHRRLQRLEARRFLDKYEPTEPHHQLLLELAKLDFNMVQSLHQKDLRELSRWWSEMGLASKLEFVRDRLMEVYFWALGMAPDPQFSECRKAVTKMFGLVTIIDDVYDVYGTLEELQLFTDAVERWDVNATNTLPDYMKLCYLALYNTVNDTAYSILKEKGHNSLSYLAKSWCELCKAFLQEAKWSNNKIIPAFSKYLENASVSSSGVTLLAPSYFSVCNEQDISDQALCSLTNFHGLVRSSCTIFRLCNDLATSAAELERGETTNSIPSYMHENDTSEEQAREKLRKLIDAEWKKMNRERVLDSTLPEAFKEIAINMARVSHCTYQYGDGIGRPDYTTENRIKLLLIDSVPIN